MKPYETIFKHVGHMNEYDLLGSLHWVVKIHSSKSSKIVKIRRVAERDTGNGPGRNLGGLMLWFEV